MLVAIFSLVLFFSGCKPNSFYLHNSRFLLLPLNLCPYFTQVFLGVITALILTFTPFTCFSSQLQFSHTFSILFEGQQTNLDSLFEGCSFVHSSYFLTLFKANIYAIGNVLDIVYIHL